MEPLIVLQLLFKLPFSYRGLWFSLQLVFEHGQQVLHDGRVVETHADRVLDQLLSHLLLFVDLHGGGEEKSTSIHQIQTFVI